MNSATNTARKSSPRLRAVTDVPAKAHRQPGHRSAPKSRPGASAIVAIRAAAGASLGVFVPLASYCFAHHEYDADPTRASLFVAAALLFSMPKVYRWAHNAFGSWYEALGFCCLLEGAMVLSTTPALRIASLVFLAGINAFSAGYKYAKPTTKLAR